MAATSISSATNKLTDQSPPLPLRSAASRPSANRLSFSNSSISLQKLAISATSRSLSSRGSATVAVSVLKTAKESELASKPRNSDPVVKAPKPTILVSEKLGEAGLDLLRSYGDVECLYNLSPEDLCAKIGEFDALIVRSGTKVTRQVFEAAKGKLKVVGRAGVGIDNVDLQAATEFGCLVVNAPTANTIAAAEHGIALLAGMARNVAQADASTKAGMMRFFLVFNGGSIIQC